VCGVLPAGALNEMQRQDGQIAWCTEPKDLIPGKRAKLLYNAQTGPLSFMAPLPSAPSVILGHNGWLDTQVILSTPPQITLLRKSCAHLSIGPSSGVVYERRDSYITAVVGWV
jgi:hypothetical protein